MKKHPNILLIMVDELAAQALPTYGHKVVKAPHLSALGDSSFVFENAYTNSPICAPARASLMTGRLVPDIGTWDNGAEFRAELLTIPYYLRLLDYRTALSGKMHFIGPDQLHGFNTRLTTEIYPADFAWTTNWSAPWNAPNKVAGLSMRPILESGPCVRNLQIDYDEETQFAAKQYIYDHLRSKEKDSPFFLTVSFTQPHPPFIAEQSCWDRYDGVEIDLPVVDEIPYDQLDDQAKALYFNHQRDSMPVPKNKLIDARRAYYAMISWIDDRVGELLKVLKETGIEDETIVVFTSDHGEMLGERGMWLKMCMYEWSVRVPLIIKIPGTKPGRTQTRVAHVDLLPTLLDLAQPGTSGDRVKPIEELAGRSLAPLILNSPVADSTSPVPIISDYMAGPMPSPVRMVIEGDYKLILIRDHQPLLFNLATDPNELKNLGNDDAYADIVAKLKAIAIRNFDLAEVDAQVRLSQQRRLLIRSVNDTTSEKDDWTWLSKSGDAFRYVRGWGLEKGEHNTKSLSRLPYLPPYEPN